MSTNKNWSKGRSSTWKSAAGNSYKIVSYEDGTEFHYKNGRKHRDEAEGPAVTVIDVVTNTEAREWWQDGRKHRPGARPAVVTWDNNTDLPISHEYYKNGNLHNVSGPAIIAFNNEGNIMSERWYIDGIEFRSKDDYEKAARLNQLKRSVRAKYVDNKVYGRDPLSATIHSDGESKVVNNQFISSPVISLGKNATFVNNSIDGSNVRGWDKYNTLQVNGHALGNSWRFSESNGRLIERHKINYLHCEDGPALIYPNGRKEWWHKGKRHREDGPAIERTSGRHEYWIEGKRWTKKDFNKRFKVCTNNILTWSTSVTPIKAEVRDGHLTWHPIQRSIIIDRDDGPAIQDSLGSKVWLQNNLAHREDGPAVILKDTQGNIKAKEWRIDGVLHRDDGPAVEEFGPDGATKIWFKNGLIHRDNGPAVELPNGAKVYYVDGVAMSNDLLEEINGPSFKQIGKSGLVGYFCKSEEPAKDKWVFFALGDTILTFSAGEVYGSELHHSILKDDIRTYHDYFISEAYGTRVIDSIIEHGLQETAIELGQKVTSEQCAVADKVTSHGEDVHKDDEDEELEELEELLEEELEEAAPESQDELGWGEAIGAVLAAAVVKGIAKSRKNKKENSPEVNSIAEEATVEAPDFVEL